MSDSDQRAWDRREFLRASALLAAVAGLPLSACSTDGLDPAEAPSRQQRDMLSAVAQLVIPRTDTPGAGDVGTGDFVILALAHGLEGSRAKVPGNAGPDQLRHRRRDGSLDHLAWLEWQLNNRSGGDWQGKEAAARSEALAMLDAEAFAEGVRDHPWRTIKGLILTGYYTSEVGGSQELRFELVPGRFDPDLPVTPETRAWSSDWTAVDFG